jgi:membrane associated rhomboid family serine protease/Flp pilus assembly protein TadD
LAVCKECGKERSGFSFGAQSELCDDCRKLAEAHRQWRAAATGTDAGWMSATKVLVAINVCVYIAMAAAGFSPLTPTSEQLVRSGADFGPYTLTGQYWRTITSSFVHIGIVHILLNMWCLWQLGRLLEKYVGGVMTAIVYVLTGIGAAILSLSYDPFRVSAGASGPIFGICGLLFSLLYFGDLGLTASGRNSLLGYTARFAGMNLVLGLYAGIDNMAHLGGLVTGLLMGFAFARNWSVPERRTLRQVWISAVAACVLAGFFIATARAKLPEMYGAEGEMSDDGSSLPAAISRLQTYVAGHPNDPDGHAQLGYVLQLSKREDEAQPEYEKALKLKPDYPEVQFNLGEIYLHKGRTAEAAQMMKKGLDGEKGGSDDYAEYAQALLAEKRMADAEQAARQAVSLDAKSSQAHSMLADVLRGEGKAKEADVEAKKAQELQKGPRDK